jgi:hypothetical protein
MKTGFHFLLNFTPLYLHATILGQEADKPIWVSPLVGDTLYPAQQDYYNLLPTIAGFRWAFFYLESDSSLKAKIHHAIDGIERDTDHRLSPFLGVGYSALIPSS